MASRHPTSSNRDFSDASTPRTRLPGASHLFAVALVGFVLGFVPATVGCGDETTGDDDDDDSTDTSDGDTAGTGGDTAGGVGDDDGSNGTAGTGDDDDGVTVKPCASSAECRDNFACNPDTRICEPAVGCTVASDCLGGDITSIDQVSCTIPEGKTTGVCKRVRTLCDSCLEDADCAQTGSKCLPLGGDGTTTYCAKACAGGCPQGFVCNTQSQCVPLDGSCEGVTKCASDDDCTDGRRCTQVDVGLNVCANFCASRDDCPRDKVCNTDTGSCVERCTSNPNQPGRTCATGTSCHADGNCAAPCATNEECEQRYGALFPEEVNLRCENTSCRIDGCISDKECPFPGFCDVDNYKCLTGNCRTSEIVKDDITGNVVLPGDCASGNYCVKSDFNGAPTADDASCKDNPTACACRQAACNAPGKGASILCNAFSYCCGEDPQRTCPAGIQVGQCYPAPSPPLCTECDPNAEDPCPTASGYDGNCYQTQDADGNNTGNFCGLPCETDVDCPSSMRCREIQDQNGQPAGKSCDVIRCRAYSPPGSGNDTGDDTGDDTSGTTGT